MNYIDKKNQVSYSMKVDIVVVRGPILKFYT